MKIKRNIKIKIYKQIQNVIYHNLYKLIMYKFTNFNKLKRSQYLWLIDKNMMSFWNSKNSKKLNILNFFKKSKINLILNNKKQIKKNIRLFKKMKKKKNIK